MKYNSLHILLNGCLLIAMASCKSFIEIPNPNTDLVKRNVFQTDATAQAAITGIYANLGSSMNGGGSSISRYSDLSADILDNNNPSAVSFFFNSHSLLSDNIGVNSIWTEAYASIYRANAMLEGLEGSTGLSPAQKQQLTGEALFIRAFHFFYLINQFGAVPLTLTTDYESNAAAPRSDVELVYQQIIADLTDAQKLLSVDYAFSSNEKVRVNQGACTAFLSRVYLYTQQWEMAETSATQVLENTALYQLDDLTSLFLKNSREALWQFTYNNDNTQDAKQYIIPSTGAPSGATLTPALVASFEAEDLRKKNWIDSSAFNGTMYYYPTKYKNYGISPITEYSMILRLAEVYLIRAEARAMQGKISGPGSALEDLNSIRQRAGLEPSTASTPETLMLAIEQERRHELFTEWGHRWFDLKRWPSVLHVGDASYNLADDRLQDKPNWRREAKLYPIPQAQILNDPAMTDAQNPGY